MAAVRLAERLLSETRDEVRRADTKAAQWLAAIGAGATAVIASWPLDDLPRVFADLAAWLGVAGFGFAVAALIALAMALVPRTGGDVDPSHVAYFGHVYRAGGPDHVRRHIERTADDLMPSLLTELCWLSRLAVLKYRYTRLGIVFGTCAGALVAAAAL
ncbi:Pycsar system effector family protein [Asanoa ferruginea]|uniref:Pycsar system effector family protein n=1 Tax=Asanoa ferruginea TaxID=53367 RepID=UPI0011C10023|nr:Pycsar system effector family protein [Asanoa ferruginea]